ncbi:MAG: hypothetical protein ACE5I3_06905 [Phycisphaerae bacterium]
MPDDVTNVMVTLERIHVINDEDWFGKGELYFEGNVDGMPIARSATFKAGSGEDITLSGPSWRKVVDVRAKASFQLVLRGHDEDLIWDDDLGTVTATVRKNADGEWPDGTFSRTSTSPADFVLHYRVEPVLALNPAQPETAVICREHTANPTCSTISGVSVRVLKITATVPSTPPRTARAAPPAVANAWPAPANLTFESTKTLARGPLVFNAADFAHPDALVLIRNSGGPVQLEAETDPPGVDVYFEAVRATDDAAGVGAAADLPTVTNTGMNTATMATNQRGSFYVLAYLDVNRNHRRDDDEPGIILPVILVEARIAAAADLRSVANPGNLDINFDNVPGSTHVANYTFVQVSTGDFAGAATAGVALDADVTLVGGGPDGRRGLEDLGGATQRVCLGWANNFTAMQYAGTYRDGSVIRRIQIDNLGDANGVPVSGIPLFVSGAATPPNPIAFPPGLLDSGRFGADGGLGGPHDPALGGINATFTSSAESAPVALPTGQRRTVRAVDSPGWFYLRHHPDPAKATRLRSFVHSLNSTTFLVAWTNTTGGTAPTPGTPNSLGFRTFTVIAETRWTVRAQYNITGASPHIRLVQTGAAPTITANNVDHSPGITPAAANTEVRPPLTLTSRAIDAR